MLIYKYYRRVFPRGIDEQIQKKSVRSSAITGNRSGTANGLTYEPENKK